MNVDRSFRHWLGIASVDSLCLCMPPSLFHQECTTVGHGSWDNLNHQLLGRPVSVDFMSTAEMTHLLRRHWGSKCVGQTNEDSTQSHLFLLSLLSPTTTTISSQLELYFTSHMLPEKLHGFLVSLFICGLETLPKLETNTISSSSVVSFSHGICLTLTVN